jgi:hypothetical protein
VRDGSLLTADFKPDQIPQGPKGDKGEKGEKGDAGPPGVSERQVVLSSSPSDSTNFKVITASCPAGKLSTGGGAFINGSQVAALAASSSQGATGWLARALEPVASNASWSLHVQVICAKMTP